jgi:hypothetical protein
MNRSHSTLYGIALFALALAARAERASADMVTLAPSKDNTLYESLTGDLSNGAGQHFFAGRTAVSLRRRGAIAFDVAGAVPSGATIQSASLVLHMSRSLAGSLPVTLQRYTKNWGEGTSDADSSEGGGAPSTPGDVTWIHTFYDGSLWDAAGGDFVAAISATQMVDSLEGFYTWTSTPEMVADVQGWLDAPATNFGWRVNLNAGGGTTAKRFDSREHPNAAMRPALTIVYEQVSGVPATGAGASRIALEPAVPNPFAPATALAFTVAAAGAARFSVHDATGRLLVTLVDGPVTAGRHVVRWDGRDALGLPAPAGAYFMRLESAGEVQSGKVLRVR